VLRPTTLTPLPAVAVKSCVRSTAASACGNGSTARIRSVSIDTAHAPVIDISLPAVTGCVARCVTGQPATMRMAPPTCSMVQSSRRTSTASSSVTTAFSCNTGAVKFTPAARLARKLRYRLTTKWSTPASDNEANAKTPMLLRA